MSASSPSVTRSPRGGTRSAADVTPRPARGAVAYVEGLDLLGMKLGLERMRALLARLGDPQAGIPAIHVVGSNGKSSTTRIAAAALASQGLRVGAYLSPHVSGWRERIEVDGEPVSAQRFSAAVGRVRDAAEALRGQGHEQATQFEVLTAAAFVAFRAARCEAIVVEAGLGGRYDASNVLDGAVVVLTNVALEHTDMLGPTHADVAGEKLAVAPDGSDRLVVGRLSPEGERAVAGIARARGLSGWALGREVSVRAGAGGIDVVTPWGGYAGLPLGLRGRFQRDNLAVAVAACEMLLGRRLRVTPLRAALRRVRMPGRLEPIAGRPLLVLDGAHNPAGMEALAASLPDAVGRRRPVVVASVLDDKDAVAMVAHLAGACRSLVATRSSHRRALDPVALADAARAVGLPAEVEADPEAAVARARELAGPRGAVLITGSLYLLADLRAGIVSGGATAPA